MCATRRRKLVTPRIEMNKQEIEIVDQLQYLGVVLDKKLTFRAHFNHLATKSSKLLSGLSMASRPTWGLNSDILRIIYRGAVEPSILYCASAFQDTLHKQWAKTKLAKIQRGFLLRITRAYRTYQLMHLKSSQLLNH